MDCASLKGRWQRAWCGAGTKRCGPGGPGSWERLSPQRRARLGLKLRKDRWPTDSPGTSGGRWAGRMMQFAIKRPVHRRPRRYVVRAARPRTRSTGRLGPGCVRRSSHTSASVGSRDCDVRSRHEVAQSSSILPAVYPIPPSVDRLPRHPGRHLAHTGDLSSPLYDRPVPALSLPPSPSSAVPPAGFHGQK